MSNIDAGGSRDRYRCNFCKAFFGDYHDFLEHWCPQMDREHQVFREC